MINTSEPLTEDAARALLHSTPAPRVGVDLDQAMRAGSRMSARRRLAGVTGGIAVAAAVAALAVVPQAVFPGTRQSRATVATAASPHLSSAPTPARAPASVAGIALRCPVTKLAKPPGVNGVQVTAVDPAGRYAGGLVLNTASNVTGVLWTDGVPKLLDFADSIQIMSINSSGVVVGAAQTGMTRWDFRYVNGTVSHLTVPAGTQPYGTPTVNVHGDAADTVTPQAGAAHPQGVVWKAGSTSPTTVALPEQSLAVAITDDNRLLTYTGDGTRRVIQLWDLADNGMQIMRDPGVEVTPYATAGNYATGLLGTRTASDRIFRWDLATGKLTTFPSVPDGSRAPAGTHVSSTGWIIDGVQVAYRPDGTPVRMDPPTAGDNVSTGGVTDSGDVYGAYYVPPNTSYTPAVWHCGSAA